MARPKTFDEDTALRAAAELFWSNGYDGTSMVQLEDGMGMGRQSIYNAFGDKRALFLKALAGYVDQNGEQMESTLRAPVRGIEAIRRHFVGMVDFATAEGPRRGCLVTNSILEIGQNDEEIAHRCEMSQAQVQRSFEYALRSAVEDGDLPDPTDVEATARMLLAQTYGITVLSKAGASRQELLASVRELLARLAG